MASPEHIVAIKAAFIVGLASALFGGLAWYMWNSWRNDVKAATLMERLLLVTTSEAFEFGTWDHVRRVASIQNAINMGNVARAAEALKMLEDDLGYSRKAVKS